MALQLPSKLTHGHGHTHEKTYLRNLNERCEVTTADRSTISTTGKKHATFSFPNIPEHTILRRLERLTVHKSSNNKLITNRLLRETAPFIAASLTHIFNLSLSTSGFPQQRQTERISPLLQRGQSDDPIATNYRPISLVPAIGKLLASIESGSLLQYFTKNNLISEHQFGFLPLNIST